MAALSGAAAPVSAGGMWISQDGAAADRNMQQVNAVSAGKGMQDKDFVRSALQTAMAEIEMGRLAAQKASSEEVRKFGQQMVADHIRLRDSMKSIAEQIGVSPPKNLSKQDKQRMDKLQSLSGQQFDDAYITVMVKDHQNDNDDFRTEAEQTRNQALKQAAEDGNQIIAQHLQMIDQIAKNHHLMNDKGKLIAAR